MPVISEFKNRQIHWVWGEISPALRSQLIAFWRDNGAIQDPFEAWRRSFEVACVAFDSSEQIVGVSSVYCAYCAQAEAPYWFYRTFVHEDSRTGGLAPRIFTCTFEQLKLAYAGENEAPVGLMVVAENPKLETAPGIRIIQRAGLLLLGRTVSGQSVWHRLFNPCVMGPTESQLHG